MFPNKKVYPVCDIVPVLYAVPFVITIARGNSLPLVIVPYGWKNTVIELVFCVGIFAVNNLRVAIFFLSHDTFSRRCIR